nr:polysaccharide biosynthesis tyrosine autokinase [uncultured Pseudoxanthomonas sp.]
MATQLITRRSQERPALAAASLRGDDIDIPALFSMLAARKKFILLGTAAFVLASLAYLAVVTPRYEANAVVQVESRPAIPPGISQNTAMQAPPAIPTPGTTEVQLLTSRRVIGEAISNMDLDVDVKPLHLPVVGDFLARRHEQASPGQLAAPWFGLSQYGWGGDILDIARLDVPAHLLGVPLELTAGRAGSYVLSAQGSVLARGRVGEPVSAGGVVMQVRRLTAHPGMRFQVTRHDPSAVMAALKENITATEMGRNSGVIGLVYAHADPERARRVLDEVTGAYVRQNVARMSAEAASRLEFVTEQLPKVREDLAKAQAALTAYQTRTQTLDVATQNRALLDQTIALDASIQQLRIKMTEVENRYTAAHPTYRALQDQINRFQGERNRLQGRIHGLPDTQQVLFRLNRDVEVTNQTYANLLDQAQQLEIAKASAVGNARVIDPAAVNLNSPAWPRPLPVLAAGTLLGLVVMVVVVLLQQMFRRGVEDPIDIELLGLPVYASIPLSRKGQALTHRMRHRRRDGTSRLLALNAPADLAMEALRSLRTSLHFARMRTRNNLLMISAPSPGVGKTFICANLAVTIAQTGQRVLLIDADMRRGTLHDAVGVRWENGLSDVIAGRIALDDAVRRVAGAENLSFLSRGAIPSNPSELLMHGNFSDLLKRVSGEYDIVLIDTPPVLAVTDAAVIGHHAGTCLMVVRFGLNQQREIALAKQRLEQNGVEVKGAIFNGVEKRGAGEYAYTYYEYLPAPRAGAGR